MPTVPRPSSARFLPLAILGGWLLFLLMVVAITWAGNALRGRPMDLPGTLVWNSGWLLWAGATFVVAWLTRRFPLERDRRLRSIGLHVGLGIAVGLGILALEFMLGRAIESLWRNAPRSNPFVGFIAYKFHVYFLIYWMILGATRAYDFHRKFRESELLASQLETQLAQAQLQALKTQLHPHFLFNTHHAIVSLMLKQENAAAIKMLTRLSDLLRITLRRTDQQMTSLRDELEALELYLGIQRERYGDRLAVALDIDPGALDSEVPWLLLQPLVENALKHGIDTLGGNGALHIGARRADAQLQLSVRDNGPGFPADFYPDKNGGIGLKNTAARLERIYGDRHTLAFAGAEVRVTLPLRPYAPAHE